MFIMLVIKLFILATCLLLLFSEISGVFRDFKGFLQYHFPRGPYKNEHMAHFV